MQLLEYFKELTIHPKNAKELKGLILQLAIQGKLTKKWRDEHPNVEPASILLEKIRVEKEQLLKGNKIKKEKELPEKNGNEINIDLPINWSLCRLGTIVSLKSGTTFKKVLEKEQGDYMYIKVGAMNLPGNEVEITNSNLYIDSNAKMDLALIPERSIIFPKRGGAIATNKKRIVKEPIHVDLNTMALICPNHFEFYYLKYWFDSIDLWKLNNGTSVPQINNKDILPLNISVPPLEEQKAIVEIVEQLFKEVEQLEGQTKLRIQLKDDYVSSALRTLSTQSMEHAWASLMPHFKEFITEKSAVKKLRECVLQLAVQGKLTKKWRIENPNVELASVLLEKIKAEKEQLIKDKKIKKEKPLPPITEEEIPYELPDGWEWARFQEVYDVRDGTHDSPKDSQNKLTYPLVTSKNFKNGMIDFESARRISEEDYGKVIKRSKVDKGDVLFSMIGGNIGNQVIVGDFTDFAIKNVALFKHYKYGLPEPGFINIYSKYIAMSLQNQAAGGAQPFVSLKFFRNLVLGLPSIEEQKAIIEKVNTLMAFCDQLEEAIEESTIQIEQLMQSCLKEVFER